MVNTRKDGQRQQSGGPDTAGGSGDLMLTGVASAGASDRSGSCDLDRYRHQLLTPSNPMTDRWATKTEASPVGRVPVDVFDSTLNAWGVAWVAPLFSLRYEYSMLYFGPQEREAGMKMLNFAGPVAVGVLLLPASWSQGQPAAPARPQFERAVHR